MSKYLTIGVLVASLLMPDAAVANGSTPPPYCCAPASRQQQVALAPKPFSIDVHSIDPFDLVALVAQASGRNIVLDASTPHTPVTIALRQVTLDTALTTIEQVLNYSAVEQNGIIMLAPRAVGPRIGSNGVIEAFSLQHANAAEVREAIQAALPQGSIVIPDTRGNRLIVRGSGDAVQIAGDLIAKIDAPPALDYSVANASGLTDPTTTFLGSRSVVRTVALKYISPHDAIAATRPAFIANAQASGNAQSAQLIEDPRQTAVVIVGTPDQVALESALLTSLDGPGYQVAFDVQVVDITPQNDQSDLGVLLNGGGIAFGVTPSASSSTSTTSTTSTTTASSAVSVFTGHALTVNGSLNLLIQRGQAQVLARPHVTGANSQESDLIIGQTSPILAPVNSTNGTQNFTTVDTGVVVRLTPMVAANAASVKMHLEYSAISGYVSTFPQIQKRSLDTVESLSDDESIIVGGLYQDVSAETLTKLPLLGDLPLFGPIFRNRQKSKERDQIAFIITPHIVRGSLLAAPIPADLTLPKEALESPSPTPIPQSGTIILSPGKTVAVPPGGSVFIPKTATSPTPSEAGATP